MVRLIHIKTGQKSVQKSNGRISCAPEVSILATKLNSYPIPPPPHVFGGAQTILLYTQT